MSSAKVLQEFSQCTPSVPWHWFHGSAPLSHPLILPRVASLDTRSCSAPALLLLGCTAGQGRCSHTSSSSWSCSKAGSDCSPSSQPRHLLHICAVSRLGSGVWGCLGVFRLLSGCLEAEGLVCCCQVEVQCQGLLHPSAHSVRVLSPMALVACRQIVWYESLLLGSLPCSHGGKGQFSEPSTAVAWQLTGFSNTGQRSSPMVA